MDKEYWFINVPMLSATCPYSGRMMSITMSDTMPIVSEFIKDKCHNPNNLKWLMWTYPECSKETCPMKKE